MTGCLSAAPIQFKVKYFALKLIPCVSVRGKVSAPISPAPTQSLLGWISSMVLLLPAALSPPNPWFWNKFYNWTVNHQWFNDDDFFICPNAPFVHPSSGQNWALPPSPLVTSGFNLVSPHFIASRIIPPGVAVHPRAHGTHTNPIISAPAPFPRLSPRRCRLQQWHSVGMFAFVCLALCKAMNDLSSSAILTSSDLHFRAQQVVWRIRRSRLWGKLVGL